MLLVRFALAAMLAAPLAAPASADEPPVLAAVGPSGAQIFSGPDESHYATMKLPPGTQLEVHRIDPGDWCAIRPPDGSFCLVAASALQPTNSGAEVGEVIHGGEPCWVGTELGAVDEPLFQVCLTQGERLTILGQIPSDRPPSEPVEWYQVAPPAGEFRWVRLAELDVDSQQAVRQLASESALASGAADPLGPGDGRREPAPFVEGSEDFQEPIARPSDDRPKDHAFESTSEVAKWRQARQPISTRPIPTYPHSIDQTVSAAANLPASPLPSWPEALRRLDLALSQIVLREPENWNLDAIRSELLAWQQANPTASGHGEYLLAKIDAFQHIQRGVAAAQPPSPSPPPSVSGIPPAQPGITAAPQIAITNSSQPPPMPDSATPPISLPRWDPSAWQLQPHQPFDASGYLNELVRNGGSGQSTFVLQDEQGRITHHITGAPGVNLHRYLKSKIGVVGQKGFHQSLNLDHVTAERIVSLESRLR